MRPLHVCALSSLCCLVVGCGSDSSARPDPAPDVVQQDFITEDDIVPPVVGWALWTGLTSQTSPSSNGERSHGMPWQFLNRRRTERRPGTNRSRPCMRTSETG